MQSKLIQGVRVLGLVFSGLLTIALFLRLFGYELYGWTMAILALALFEMGAEAWSRALPEAKHGQRNIVRFAMWYCIAASLASSSSEIVMATNLYVYDKDSINLITLIVIVGALIVNVAGVFAHNQQEPDVVVNNREMDLEATYEDNEYKKLKRLAHLALKKADEQFEEKSEELAKEISDMRHEKVVDGIAKAHGVKRTAKRATKGKEETQDEIDRYFEKLEHEITNAPSGNGHKATVSKN